MGRAYQILSSYDFYLVVDHDGGGDKGGEREVKVKVREVKQRKVEEFFE